MTKKHEIDINYYKKSRIQKAVNQHKFFIKSIKIQKAENQHKNFQKADDQHKISLKIHENLGC